MTVIWKMPCKNTSFGLEISNQFFLNCYISFQDMQSFFEFLFSVINHYHVCRSKLLEGFINAFIDFKSWHLLPTCWS